MGNGREGKYCGNYSSSELLSDPYSYFPQRYRLNANFCFPMSNVTQLELRTLFITPAAAAGCTLVTRRPGERMDKGILRRLA